MNKTLVSGSVFYFIRQIAVLFLQLATNFFILKWITPAEFGNFATLNIVIGILQIFSDGGFSVYLVQKKQIPALPEIKNLLSVQFFVYLTIHILVILSYFILKEKYNLISYLAILIFSLPFNILKSFSFSLLERELKFKQVSIVEVTEVFAYAIIAILLAYFGLGIWSLVIANLTKSIVGYLYSFYYNPIKLSLVIPKINYELKKAFLFGFHFHSPNLLNSFRILINPIIIGYLFGMQIVGINDRAIYIAGLPLFMLGAVQQKILFPFFSRIQDRKLILNKVFYESYYLSSFIDKLLYIPLLLILPTFFKLYFQKWVAILPFINIVVFGNMIFGSFFFSLYPALNAIGKSNLISRFSIYTLCFSWIIIYPLSLILKEYSYVYLSLILWIIGLIPIRKIFLENIGMIKNFKPFIIPLISIFPSLCLSIFVNRKESIITFPQLFIFTLFSFISYFILFYSFDKRFLISIYRLIKIKQKLQ